MIVVYDPRFVAERARLVKLAAAGKLPTVFPERSFVESGGPWPVRSLPPAALLQRRRWCVIGSAAAHS